MSTDAPIDATAVDLTDHHYGPAPEPVVSQALARRERRSEVIRPLDTDQLVASFREYQTLLPKLLDANDWQGTGNDRFVKKSGWRKIATAFDLDVQVIRWHVDRDDTGAPLRVEVLARAIAPSGRSMDGDGYCARDEFTGRRANDPKLENTMRGTATTRAKNRAIADLVGMGAVSAEETVPAGQTTVGDEASEQLQQVTRNVLLYLLDTPELADAAFEEIVTTCGGHMPRSAGQAIVLLGTAIKKHREGRA